MSASVDCIIVGGRPACLTAAVYLARYHRHVAILVDGESRADWIPSIRNYPVIPTSVSAHELLPLLAEQASRFDVEIVRCRVNALTRSEGGFNATTGSGETTRAQAVIVATGIVDKAPAIEGFSAAVSAG